MAFTSTRVAIGTVGRVSGTNQLDGTLTGTSTAANITSDAYHAGGEAFNLSYQFGILTGTPTGYFVVDVSNDPRANDPVWGASAVWTEVQRVAYTTGVDPSGLASSGIMIQNGWRFSRIRWVGASAGTCFAFASGVSV